MGNLKTKIHDLILDYFDGFSMGRAILAGLVVMTPIFLFILAPSIIFYSMDGSIRYKKYPWLEDFAWIWAACTFGIMFLTVLIYLIVTGIRDMQWTKKFYDKHPELDK